MNKMSCSVQFVQVSMTMTSAGIGRRATSGTRTTKTCGTGLRRMSALITDVTRVKGMLTKRSSSMKTRMAGAARFDLWLKTDRNFLLNRMEEVH